MVTHGVITECGKGFNLVHWTDLDSFFDTRSTNRMGESTERDSVKFSWPESLFVPFSLFLQPVLFNTLPSINNVSVPLYAWRMPGFMDCNVGDCCFRYLGFLHVLFNWLSLRNH